MPDVLDLFVDRGNGWSLVPRQSRETLHRLGIGADCFIGNVVPAEYLPEALDIHQRHHRGGKPIRPRAFAAWRVRLPACVDLRRRAGL
ncbi:hypothetical protein CAL13_05125 [Bordetella genomosp. 9]|uniref:Uncharacterized protein n=1 Tax=Bordetella genomosp. 9 TaxID=1416803 RepID=A0A1W6YX56_9BORD|nr:hypothetical protein CAL13_05125 [Bordetella genomosp. 9]